MTQILTKEDKVKITQALAAITEVKKDIFKAKSAGIDVSGPEQSLLDTETKLQAIKRVYFPG